METTQITKTIEPADVAADHAAVNELINDIEGELHLHLARVQEFMDGTPEFSPIGVDAERERLEKLRSALADAVCAVSSA